MALKLNVSSDAWREWTASQLQWFWPLGVRTDPVQAFQGRLDVPEITDNAQSCTVTISYESRLIDLNRPRSWR